MTTFIQQPLDLSKHTRYNDSHLLEFFYCEIDFDFRN